MGNSTTLIIPKEILTRAKELNINCSEAARDAITAKIKEKEREMKDGTT